MAEDATEGFREALEARELESAKNSPELLASHQAATGVSDPPYLATLYTASLSFSYFQMSYTFMFYWLFSCMKYGVVYHHSRSCM